MLTKFDHYEFENSRLDKGYCLAYYFLGITGEAGEVSEIFKKAVRRGGPNVELSMDEREKLIYELGDVLWYVTAIARKYGWNLQDIAEKNIKKLDYREEMGR